jgi:hypothetical protein
VTTSDAGTTFVVGERTFVVRVDADLAPSSVAVTVTLDGRFEWTFTVPGWRPLSFGSGSDRSYLWSARDIIVLPLSAEEDPSVVTVDEDLLYVFYVEAGWVLVCETSVRRTVSGTETARLDLGDVVEHAAWDRDLLIVRCAGTEHRIRVHGECLIT